jgi:hypothetical protein
MHIYNTEYVKTRRTNQIGSKFKTPHANEVDHGGNNKQITLKLSHRSPLPSILFVCIN